MLLLPAILAQTAATAVLGFFTNIGHDIAALISNGRSAAG